MPNNTITDSHSPEGHAFCVCSVLVVDKTVGISWCMHEFRNTVYGSRPQRLTIPHQERQEPQYIKTLKTFCGSKSATDNEIMCRNPGKVMHSQII